MSLSRSISRLKWRFSQGKSFAPNQDDINALNEIMEFCSSKMEETFNDNQLFGKLYCYLFVQFVKYYKTTYDDPIPQKELNKLCDMDLGLLFQKLNDSLEQQERNKWIKSSPNKISDLPGLDVDETTNNLKIMANMALKQFS